ncbi:MAG: hypothetical protein KGL39_35165 [Patescibacteria group bacterium]|nr:hypothetical protein [Patescibacteria group bacterium]
MTSTPSNQELLAEVNSKLSEAEEAFGRIPRRDIAASLEAVRAIDKLSTEKARLEKRLEAEQFEAKSTERTEASEAVHKLMEQHRTAIEHAFSLGVTAFTIEPGENGPIFGARSRTAPKGAPRSASNAGGSRGRKAWLVNGETLKSREMVEKYLPQYLGQDGFKHEGGAEYYLADNNGFYQATKNLAKVLEATEVEVPAEA